MTIWDAAGVVIDATFVDPEPLIYTGAGLVSAPVAAIRIDEAAPSFDGPGDSLRGITYEVPQAAFNYEPTDTDSFIHRGLYWNVQNVTRRDDIGKWWLTVSQGYPE